MTKVSRWALVAALSGFLFGFDTAVISGAEQSIQRVWATSNVLHGIAMSAALWGTVLGAMFGGWPSDRFGRKPTLLWIGVLYAVSALGSGLAWDPASFIVFRFVGGIGVGASSIAAPAYLAEIAPRAQRGILGALFQMMIVLGILVAFASNYVFNSIGPDGWRWMLGVEFVPALAYILATFWIPESPRWLLLRAGRQQEAREILHRIDPVTAEAELRAVATELSHEVGEIGWRSFFSPRLARPLMLAVAIAFFNQMSGINAIIYYAPRIFEIAGAGSSSALLATIGIGAINLVFTLIGMSLIDRSGRKPLMYIGSLGYIISLALISFGFATDRFMLVLPFLLAFIAAHAIGQGAVIWVYISEIFPSSARAKGQTLGSSTHWISAATLTLVMPSLLAEVAPAKIFLAFALLMVLQLLWVRFAMVETRGRALEDIAAGWEA